VISYVTSDGDYLAMVAGVGGPKVLHSGERCERPYPEAAWAKAIQEKKLPLAGFACNRCQASVLINRKHRTQICRCAKVAYASGHEFKTGEEWTAWQDDFDEQLKDPAPENYWVEPEPNSEGVPQGKEKLMTPEAKTWLKRKLGLSAELELSDDGHTMQLPGTPGALSVSSRGNLTAIDLPDDEDGLQLFLAAQQIQAVRESPPQVILVLGDDDDYIWPSIVNERLIRGMPYSCSRCGKRVKQAPIGTGWILTCLCLQACYPPGTDKRPPRTRHEWDRLRVEVATETARVRAKTAGVDN
jgi:hypothetical protein